MKIIFGIIVILIILVMWPHVRRGEFLAPDPIAPNTWMADYVQDGDLGPYNRALATPPEGYGFRRYDVWNQPPLEGRSATREDFQLRW